jgi:hypothetical protein
MPSVRQRVGLTERMPALSDQIGSSLGGAVRSLGELHKPFRYFNSSPEVIRLTVMMYVCYPLSLRQVENLLFERWIDICHESVRIWWNRLGPLFAAQIRKRRVDHRSYSSWLCTWTRCRPRQWQRTISGGLLIARATCSRCSPPSAGIGGLRLSF